MASADPMSLSTIERRDYVRRAEVMRRVVESLCSGNTSSDGLPAAIVARILRHLAVKGLARASGRVDATPLLMTPADTIR